MPKKSRNDGLDYAKYDCDYHQRAWEEMAMTNLSEELCKICGVKPKQFIKNFKTREKAASFGRKITGIPKFMGNKFDIGSYTDNQSIYQVHWKEYPNFENPENFVRLWEILSKQSKIELIQRLITRLRVEGGFYADNVKQTIREEEWNYVQ